MLSATRSRCSLALIASITACAVILIDSSTSSAVHFDGIEFAAAVTESNPVGYWRLSESSGPFTDSSPLGLHAGIVEPGQERPPFHRNVPGILGTCREASIDMAAPLQPCWLCDPPFQSWIRAPQTGRGDTTFRFLDRHPFSLEAWIKPTSASGNLAQGILGSYSMDQSGSVNVGYRLIYRAPDQLVFSRRGWGRIDGHSHADGTGIAATLPPGSWAYVVATYDGETMRLFLNGNEATSAPSSVTVAQLNGDVNIGRFVIDSGVLHYSGFFYSTIDEPAI